MLVRVALVLALFSPLSGQKLLWQRDGVRDQYSFFRAPVVGDLNGDGWEDVATFVTTTSYEPASEAKIGPTLSVAVVAPPIDPPAWWRTKLSSMTSPDPSRGAKKLGASSAAPGRPV